MAGNSPIAFVTFHDTETSVSDGKTYSVDNNANTMNVDFVISEGTTFVANFEGKTTDKSEWDAFSAVNLNTIDVGTTATTLDVYQIDLTGWSYIRVRLSSISGIVSVYGKAVG